MAQSLFFVESVRISQALYLECVSSIMATGLSARRFS
jgi:hypothetical protein